MKRYAVKNEQGLTLVEVLAALVILGIFFIGILTILPQMTLFNARTETKLDTMNLARQEMAIILSSDEWNKQLETSADDPTSLEPDFLTAEKIHDEMVNGNLGYTKNELDSSESESITSDSFVRYEKTDVYRYVADIYLQCEPFLATVQPEPGSMALEPCKIQDTIKLYALHLRVYTDDGAVGGNYRLSSETYSYIPYKAIQPPIESAGE